MQGSGCFVKKGTVFSLRQIGISDFFNRYKFSLLMCLIFIFGFIISIVCYVKTETFSKYIFDEFASYINLRVNKKFIYAFLNSFISYFTMLFAVFLSGTSLFGIVLIPFIIFSTGMYYGGFSSILYSQYALKGVAFNAVFLVPTILILSACLFFSAKESLLFSFRIAKLCIQNNSYINVAAEFKMFCGKYILSILLLIILSLVDAALSVTLLKLFNF